MRTTWLVTGTLQSLAVAFTIIWPEVVRLNKDLVIYTSLLTAIISALQAIQALWAQRFNTDGTPQSVAFDPKAVPSITKAP